PTATGWPEAVAHLRLPQNVACSFPALRSSNVASQHCDRLQLPIREIQLWSHQRNPLTNLMKHSPPNSTFPTTTAKHLVPVALHGPIDLLQGTDVSGNAEVCIVTAQHSIEIDDLLSNRQMTHAPHQVLGLCERSSKT